MKCENCGKEFSDTVYPLHILRCKKSENKKEEIKNDKKSENKKEK